jgi:methyl-accepting chemotaxis protein
MAATIRESASTAHELNTLSESLTALVSRFRA